MSTHEETNAKLAQVTNLQREINLLRRLYSAHTTQNRKVTAAIAAADAHLEQELLTFARRLFLLVGVDQPVQSVGFVDNHYRAENDRVELCVKHKGTRHWIFVRPEHLFAAEGPNEALVEAVLQGDNWVKSYESEIATLLTASDDPHLQRCQLEMRLEKLREEADQTIKRAQARREKYLAEIAQLEAAVALIERQIKKQEASTNPDEHDPA